MEFGQPQAHWSEVSVNPGSRFVCEFRQDIPFQLSRNMCHHTKFDLNPSLSRTKCLLVVKRSVILVTKVLPGVTTY